MTSLKSCKSATFKVAHVEKKEKKRNPVAPFITSTIQQEARRHFGFSATRTMNIAQTLYEGVELGQEGAEGLITYMRTDSVRIAPEAIEAVRQHIAKKYGKEYLPETPASTPPKKAPKMPTKPSVQRISITPLRRSKNISHPINSSSIPYLAPFCCFPNEPCRLRHHLLRHRNQ